MANERDVQLSIAATRPSGCCSAAPRGCEPGEARVSHGRGLTAQSARGSGALLTPVSCRDRPGDTAQCHGGMQQLWAGWALLILQPRWGKEVLELTLEGLTGGSDGVAGAGRVRQPGHVPGIRPLPPLAITPFPSEVPEEEQASWSR